MFRGKLVRLKAHSLPASWEEALDLFLLWKEAEGRSATTLEDYRRTVSIFFRRYPGAWEGGQKLKEAVLSHFSQKVKPATYNIRLTYLKAFFAWCVREGLLEENPLEGFKRRKDGGRVVSLDPETLRRLLALPDTSTFAGLRDYCLMLLTLDTGIRPKEAFSLLPGDLNLRALEVRVLPEAAKTRAGRTLFISPATAEALRRLLQARHPSWPDSTPVFCTAEGRPMNRHAWAERMEAYSERLGVKVRPYDLRHAFAVNFLKGGGHAFALQKLLGHSDLSMTRRYVALTQEDLRAEHARASPLSVVLPQRHRVRRARV